MAKYGIWDRKTPILTHTMKIFTADQWMEKHPVLRMPSVVPVCGGGEINGSFVGTLGAMVERAEAEGCDFSECVTNEEKLAKIEEFEKEQNTPSTTPSAEERIAAALEYQVMATLPDEETAAE